MPSGSAASMRLPSPRILAVAGAGLVVLIVALVLILRGCTANDEPDAVSSDALADVLEARSLTSVRPSLAEASLGTLQSQASVLVNHDALIAWIGAHSSSATSYAGLTPYRSYHALALTSRIPQAAGYARMMPAALASSDMIDAHPLDPVVTGNGLPYTGHVTKGIVPMLYQWDARWGYTSYCDDPLGLTGCGVTTASMAYMGITGRTDLTPAAMARLAEELDEAHGGTNSTLFTNPDFEAATGMDGTRLRDTASALTTAVASGSLVAMSVKPNTLANGGHYVLVIGLNADGTLQIHDPNSPTNTARSWDPNELMQYENAMIALKAAGSES